MEETDENLAEIISLPQDLVEEIFLLLPLKSLIKFRCLSKLWYAQIARPSFIQKHRCDDEDYYPMYFKEETSGEVIRILGSCDDLYCCSSLSKRSTDIYLYNPSIRRAIKVPGWDYHTLPKKRRTTPHFTFNQKSAMDVGYEEKWTTTRDFTFTHKWAFGVGYEEKWTTTSDFSFAEKSALGVGYEEKRRTTGHFTFTQKSALGVGYEDSTRDVKLVAINEIDDGIMIYSANENSWKKINKVSPDSIVLNWSVFIGGCIYWCGKSTLMAFDLSEEVFRKIPYPTRRYGALPPPKGSDSCSLSVVNGSLCFMSVVAYEGHHYSIYKLKQDEDEWEEMYEGPGPKSYDGIWLTGEGKFLIGRFNQTVGYRALTAYDPKTKEEKFIRHVPQNNPWLPMRKKTLQLLQFPGQYFHVPSI